MFDSAAFSLDAFDADSFDFVVVVTDETRPSRPQRYDLSLVMEQRRRQMLVRAARVRVAAMIAAAIAAIEGNR